MKLELNIGLSSKTLGIINPVQVLNALTGAGFALVAYRVVPSDCTDGAEDCLAVIAEAPADALKQLAALSERYGQECIAFAGFAGPDPYPAFDRTFWKEPVEIEREASKPRLEAFQFIGWLESTLIPDLRADGFEGTPADFETLIEHYRALARSCGQI